MNKNKPYASILKNVFRFSAASLVVIAGVVTFNSCKKDTLKDAQVVELGEAPTQVDSFVHIPTKRTKINLKVKDAQGKVMTIDAFKKSLQKGQQTLACGSGAGLDMMELYSLGFAFEDKCFANAPSQIALIMTYELTLPADMEPIRENPASRSSVRTAPFGWASNPSGPGGRNLNFIAITLVNSYTQNGVSMKTWRLTTYGSQMVMGDYCLNNILYSNFQVATNCPNFTIVSSNDINGEDIAEDFNVTQLQVPGVTLSGAMVGGSHRITVNWQVPFCSIPGCSDKGGYQWSQTIKYRYRKQGVSAWTVPPPDVNPRTNILSYYIGNLQSGPYTFQYAADLGGTWSDWQVKTVVVD